jgi:hypothetical protein
MDKRAIEAARIADALHQLALDANRLTIELRGTDAVSNASLAFHDAACAAARAADVVKILGHPGARGVAA